MQHYNIGIFGLVDNGKSTFVKNLTKTELDRHTLEKQKGMTIKLNYASFYIKNKELSYESSNPDYVYHIVDTPGHEVLFTKMLTSISLVDIPVLIISPYAQDMSLQRISKFLNLLSNFEKIIIVITKLDLVLKETLLSFVATLEEYLKKQNISYELIPFSKDWEGYKKLFVQVLLNISDNLHLKIHESDECMYLAFKSFNINTSKTKILEFTGGIIGGVLKAGSLKKDEDIYINYIKIDDKIQSIKTKINKILQTNKQIEILENTGFSTLETTLDPNICSNDKVAETIISKKPLEKVNKLEIQIIKDLDSSLRIDTVVICVLHLRVKARLVKNKKTISALLNEPIPNLVKGSIARICCKVGEQWIIKIIGKIL